MTEHRRRLLRILPPWIFLFVLLAAGYLWGIDEWRRRVRWDNDSHAYRGRFILLRAEREFFANDVDGNGIRDYWTGDIAGLYRFGLIDRDLAAADVCPLVAIVPKPVPWHGYYVRMLERDENETPPEPYAQVTDPASGKVHHRSKVAVCLYPAEPGVSGSFIYITNENGPYRRHPWPGPGGVVPKNWPKDADLRYWTNDCGG